MNIQNIIKPKNKEWEDGIYFYDLDLHEPRLFIKEKDSIKVFDGDKVHEMIFEFAKFQNELNLDDKKTIKYLKALYIFLKRNYYDGALHVNKCLKYANYLSNLGSIHMTLISNNTVVSAQDYGPFGEENGSYVTGKYNQRYKFTGKERDKENNLDYVTFLVELI